jgi:uncharacterized membrane protein YtjA (UPF0391 family)
MIRAAIAFFVLGLVSILLGFNGVGGLSLEFSKMILFLFLILSIVSYIASLYTTRNKNGKAHKNKKQKKTIILIR